MVPTSFRLKNVLVKNFRQSLFNLLACSPTCFTCVGNPTNCTGCQAPTPYLYNESCISDCLSGTYLSIYSPETCYGSSNLLRNLILCKDCSSNCGTCSGDASNCLSCASNNPYLYNGKCWIACPPGSVEISNNICTGKYWKF